MLEFQQEKTSVDTNSSSYDTYSEWSAPHLVYGRTIKSCKLGEAIVNGERADKQLRETLTPDQHNLISKYISSKLEAITQTKTFRKLVLKRQEELLTSEVAHEEKIELPKVLGDVRSIEKVAKTNNGVTPKKESSQTLCSELKAGYERIGVNTEMEELSKTLSIERKFREEIVENGLRDALDLATEVAKGLRAKHEAEQLDWLNEEEIKSVVEIYRRGEIPRSKQEALESMVELNRPLVVSAIKGFLNKHRDLDFDELEQIGLLSLWRAAELFDVDLGFQFSTTATIYIRQDLVTNLKQRINSNPYQSSLDYIEENSDSDSPMTSTLEDRNGSDPQKIVEKKELSESLRELKIYIAELNEIERHIIRERFGLTNQEPRTLKEIGDERGVSRERIRQIEEVAIEKLREYAPESLKKRSYELIQALKNEPVNEAHRRYNTKPVKPVVEEDFLPKRRSKKRAYSKNTPTAKKPKKPKIKRIIRGMKNKTSSPPNLDALKKKVKELLPSLPEQVRDFLLEASKLHPQSSAILPGDAKELLGVSRASFYRLKKTSRSYLGEGVTDSEFEDLFSVETGKTDIDRVFRKLPTEKREGILKRVKTSLLPILTESDADIIRRRLGMECRSLSLEEIAAADESNPETIRRSVITSLETLNGKDQTLYRELKPILFPRSNN